MISPEMRALHEAWGELDAASLRTEQLRAELAQALVREEKARERATKRLADLRTVCRSEVRSHLPTLPEAT